MVQLFYYESRGQPVRKLLRREGYKKKVGGRGWVAGWVDIVVPLRRVGPTRQCHLLDPQNELVVQDSVQDHAGSFIYMQVYHCIYVYYIYEQVQKKEVCSTKVDNNIISLWIRGGIIKMQLRKNFKWKKVKNKLEQLEFRMQMRCGRSCMKKAKR
ncbi:hypothetical protein HELRODRAFT_172923 [Helobdella robusta]|uniref:Uncharacterized protein n=1 Tax=Helobdella robusta TaxID=6412 RepID=T1F650_HELRO|nr:hypothetical protein HELRODRAFT_172923 [Helobdella robusta]ESO03895.1 hypothetical protein HELRODRAFT_172923 [Helobdella robusta]